MNKSNGFFLKIAEPSRKKMGKIRNMGKCKYLCFKTLSKSKNCETATKLPLPTEWLPFPSHLYQIEHY